MSYEPIYQLYVVQEKELVKLDESPDKDLMLEKLKAARENGYKQAHIQYSFERGGKMNDPCWDGYDMFGTKEKSGKEVPNCIPEMATGGKTTLDIGLFQENIIDDEGTMIYFLSGKEAGKISFVFDQNGLLSENLDHKLYQSELYISIIEVEPEFRNKGIAKLLLNKIKDFARNKNIDVITLYRDSGLGCVSGSEKDTLLKNLYSSVGFIENDPESCTMFYSVSNEQFFKTGGKTKEERNYRVRFHLGAGKNFMNWKIEQINPREDWFYDPSEVQLVMTKCVLTNKPLRAEKIYTGEINKEPIAYVQCNNVSVIEGSNIDVSGAKKLSYNPRVNPFWFDENGNNIDNETFEVLFTQGRSVYTKINDQLYEFGGIVEFFETGGQIDMFSDQKTETLITTEAPNLLELFADVTDQPDLTVENVALEIRKQRLSEPEPQLTLLSFGGGQDSWAILYKMIKDEKFRKDYAPNDLVVVMSDTGNEHPYTYKANLEAKKLCEQNGIPFYFLEAGDKYHTAGWSDLKSNMRRNSTILAAWGKKSCTSSLKIAPIDKFMYEYMSNLYGYRYSWGESIGKNWETYQKQFRSKARVIIGFAMNEETRVLNTLKMTSTLLKWKQKHIQFCYPLVEQGWDRAAAQKIIKEYHPYLIAPSNCMICFFQSNEEIVWLERNYPEEFAEWVEIENSKLTAEKWLSKEKNYGVYGKLNLIEKLAQAKNTINDQWKDGALAHKKIGEWTNDELWEYKLSHGHCVKSVY
jgi:GNAT superfamily N-acetyltransferase